jgi:transcriptional regulator with XRE-family HTH domain
VPGLTPSERRALADTVRALRARERLTQQEVAERAGLGRNFVSDLEAGRRRASFDSVVAVARGIGVPLGELIALYEILAERTP